MCNYYLIDEKILYICKYKYSFFINKSNVVGLGLGYKVKCGFITRQKCIKVFVTKKVSSITLSCENLIPTLYNGILTDVVEIGFPTSCGLTKKIRPVLGGYSIGAITDLTSGSLGCLVKKNFDYYILGCNHTLAQENSLPIGTVIVQPSVDDGGKAPSDTVARLSEFIPLKFNKGSLTYENVVDCALAKVSKKSLISPKIAILGTIKGTRAPALESYTEKVGKTTELTRGQITAIGATLSVNFKKGKCTFLDQIITTNLSDSGDSGALLMDSNNYAIGLLFGKSETCSFFNPISTVLQKLRVRIVTKNI